MNAQFIIFALSGTGSMILFILLLLVAGVIGYLTAWFYAKSVYTPVIKTLEEEKKELNNRVAALRNDISALNATISKLEKNIVELEGELAERDKTIKELKKGEKAKKE